MFWGNSAVSNSGNGRKWRLWAPHDDWWKCFTDFANWPKKSPVSVLHCVDTPSCDIMVDSFRWSHWHMQRGWCDFGLCRTQFCVCGWLCFWSSNSLYPNKQRKGESYSSYLNHVLAHVIDLYEIFAWLAFHQLDTCLFCTWVRSGLLSHCTKLGNRRIIESLLLEHDRHFNLVWCNESDSYELRSFVNCGKIELLHLRAAILVQHYYYYYYYYFHLLIAVFIYAH